MDAQEIRRRADALPREPGVYEFETDGTVLYVGKALDLADRVRSYVDPRSERIRRMVERADGIDVSVTDTETQALLLEANLVKRHQPRYNVRLKDDKSYPLVQLTDHEFPRIEITRDPDSGATVFGPFTDKGRLETVVKALRETYGTRGCSDYKFAGRDRPCLDYEVGLCSAPCTGEISLPDYTDDVTAVEQFFEGETGVLADPLRREMDRAAQNREYERAANLRDRLDAVEAFHGGGEAAVTGTGDEDREETVDVLGVSFEGTEATVARLHSEDGKLVDRERHTLEAPEIADPQIPDRTGAGDPTDGPRTADRAVAGTSGENRAGGTIHGEDRSPGPAPGGNRAGDVLSAFVPQYYAERPLPDAILLSERPTDEEVLAWLDTEGVATRVPGAGREATLVDLALKNARRRTSRADEARALADALGLAHPARRIEAFDVSHAGGRAVVGSNVTFVDGSAVKSDYRRKKLPEGNDDYAAMCELVAWRAERAVAGRDDRPTPDLLLVDGGRAQLEAAREGLDGTGWEVPVVALAKEDERVVTPDGTHDWPSDADHLHLLQRARDEAHRFAVQYHQGLRDEVRTALDEVPGIGPALRRRLLRRFGSVAGVREASVDELREVDGVGTETAETIRARL